MELFYLPGACSLGPHIALAEADLPVTLRKVDMTASGPTVDGEDYRRVNPLGLVPALRTDEGEIITEAAVVLQYIASLVPDARLGDVTGKGRWHLQQVLNFLATELHKSFGPLFKQDMPADARPVFQKIIEDRFSVVQSWIGPSGYLVGDDFTIADAYLFTILGWAQFLKMDMGRWPQLGEYAQRIGARPAVQKALKEEGLA